MDNKLNFYYLNIIESENIFNFVYSSIISLLSLTVDNYLHTKVTRGNYWADEMVKNASISDQEMFQNLLYLPETRHSHKIVEIPHLNGDILTHGLYYKHLKHWLK